MNHIGSKIKKLVDEQKITRKDFAQLINKSEGYVYKLFEYENINTELLNEICIALKVPISYFFNDNIYNVIEENKTVISEPNTSYNREVKQTGSINLNGINHGTIEIKQHELDLLRFENDGLKKEVKYLKEIIELLKNK
ncbi:MAG TPA: hypothetical protein DCS17_02920 [Flavobacterium sp.]|nr:hypothetical protein [Flavobacterium sp.]